MGPPDPVESDHGGAPQSERPAEWDEPCRKRAQLLQTAPRSPSTSGIRPGSIGRPNRYPCTTSHDRSARYSSCSTVSTPSATTDRPNEWPNAMIADVIAPLCALLTASRTKLLSSLMQSIGKYFR